MSPLQSLADYELFIYTVQGRHSSIKRSTLTVIRRGARVARVTGELEFESGFRLNVREKLSFEGGGGQIEGYAYEIWRGSELLCWYDSQPHPQDPALAETQPHHKHVPPDIKHHRIPASDLSFAHPNLPGLIREIEILLTRSLS